MVPFQIEYKRSGVSVGVPTTNGRVSGCGNGRVSGCGNWHVSGCGSNCNVGLGWKVTLIIMYINGSMGVSVGMSVGVSVGVSVGLSVGVAVGVAVSVEVPKALLWGFTSGSRRR